MIASGRRGQMGMQMLAPQDEVPVSGGGGVDTESFWSSFSVVESLFSDELMSAPGTSNNGSINNNHHHGVVTTTSSGSRLPIYRGLKSAPQEVPVTSYDAFPPLPPSPALYDDGGHNHHNGHSNGHQHNNRRARHSPRVGSPIASNNGHLSPVTNNRHAHHNSNGNSIGNGHASNGNTGNGSNNNRYYDAFNGYNHFVGMSNGYGSGEHQLARSPHTPPMSPQMSSGFSIFSDFPGRASVPLVQQMASSPSSSSFALGPDIGGPAKDRDAPNGRMQPRDFAVGSPKNGVVYHHQPAISKMGFAVGEREGDALQFRLDHHHHQQAHHQFYPQQQQQQQGHHQKHHMQQQPQQEEEGAFFILSALPDEHLMKVLGYLAAKDLTNLQLVGKRRLAALTTHDALWKDLYLRRWKLPEVPPPPSATPPPSPGQGKRNHKNNKDDLEGGGDDEDSSSDEWAWITSLLQQNERWKDIFQSRHSAERWRIGTLKMFNGCWGFISQHAPGDAPPSASPSSSSSSLSGPQQQQPAGGAGQGETLDIFFHRKDIAPEGDWYEDWWLKDTPGVSRSQKCGYWDTFLCGRVVRYKQRAAYAQGRRPQACNISFVGDERRERVLPGHPDGPAVPPTRFLN